MNEQGKVNNASYKTNIEIGAAIPKQVLWYIVSNLFFHTKCLPFNRLKTALLKAFGASVGKGVVIKPSVNIKYPWKLTIGDYSWIGECVWIDNLAQVTIGNNVCVSQGALLLCGNHNYKRTGFDLIVAGIVLEEGVWVGARSTICPGVTCGSHSVLAVGSIVTQNTEAYGIYKGNPAQKYGQRIIS